MNNFNGNKLIQELTKIQSELFSRIKLENNFQIKNIQLIAGVDLSYWDMNERKYGACSIVIIDCSTKGIVEKSVQLWGNTNSLHSGFPCISRIAFSNRGS